MPREKKDGFAQLQLDAKPSNGLKGKRGMPGRSEYGKDESGKVSREARGLQQSMAALAKNAAATGKASSDVL